jgi:Spy/CpxP family protein refolding chaperone
MTHFFKRRINRILGGILGATLLVGGLSACGHHERSFGATLTAQEYTQRRDKMVDRAAGKLDLNADQKQRLRALGDKLFEQRTALMGQSKDPRAEIKSLIAGEKFDTAKAQTLINEKTAVIQTRSPEVLAAIADFYNSLNQTQQQKVRALMEGRHGWFRRD